MKTTYLLNGLHPITLSFSALGTLNIPEHTWEILSGETFLVTLISSLDLGAFTSYEVALH